MGLGLSTLFREIFSETTDSPPFPAATDITTSSTLTTSTVTNSTNGTFFIVHEEEMHYSTATGLVVTGLIVLIVVSCFILCFVLRKYCRCAYGLHYSVNYGKTQRGAVLVPTEDNVEAGDMSKMSMNAADSGIGFNSRAPSQPRQPPSRPPTPGQQRPPRPPPAASRSPVPPEQRPLLGEGEPKSLQVQATGLYPTTETSPQDQHSA